MTVDQKIHIPVPFPSAPFGKFGMHPTEADPFGYYSGMADGVADKPVRDVGDM